MPFVFGVFLPCTGGTGCTAGAGGSFSGAGGWACAAESGFVGGAVCCALANNCKRQASTNPAVSLTAYLINNTSPSTQTDPALLGA